MSKPRVVTLCLLVALTFALSTMAFSTAYADNTDMLSAADADLNESVTVYLTVSDDGEFVVGNDNNGTVLANTPIAVEWFDLGEYGLERFAYEGASGRPTLLHLLIRATEQYYLGRVMEPEDFDYAEKAMWVTNNPGSLYLKYFWGHDENLLYHVNDVYPEASPGWGLTCDRIVLKEGDTVDLAMFTNWGINTNGAFAFFKSRQLSARTGEDVVLEGESVGGMTSSSAMAKAIMQNAEIRVSANDGYSWAKAAATTDGEGRVSLRFDEPGKYLVSAGPEFPAYESGVGANYRCVAPPIAVVRVTDEALPPLRVSFDSRGGSSVPSQDVARYATCAKPGDPVRSGYAFRGWYEDQGLTQEYDFGCAVTSDFTLYAKWEKEAALKTDIAMAKISADRQVYSGHALTPAPRVVLAGRELTRGVDYAVSYSNNVNAGEGRIVVTGIGSYTGQAVGAFIIAKAANGLVVKPAKKVLTAKRAKKAVFKVAKAFKVSGNASGGKIAYKLAKVPKKAKKYVKLTKAGKLTVKKGCPKGAYKLKVNVTQAETPNYQGKVIKGVVLKIRVK